MFKKRKNNSEIKFFISIGAGLNQIPLIKEARKLGFHVIGVDQNTSAPGLLGCDLKIQESISDRAVIYQKLNETLFDGTITGILTRSYGEAIRTSAYLSEKFNIPYIPFKESERFINKNLMKEAFIAGGITASETIKLPPRSKIDKIPQHHFPMICKPVVGHAKKGVTLLHSPADLKKNWPSVKEKKNLIYEKFITGDEVIIIGLVDAGKFYLVDVTDKTVSDGTSFVDLIHSSPSRYFHRREDFINTGQKITDIFRLKSTPLIIECIITTDGRIHVIEAVPEFGGEFLCDIAVPARTGYNIIAQAIRSVTQTGFKPPQAKKPRKAVVVRYITGPGGRLLSYNPEKPRRNRSVIFSRIFKEIGSSVSVPENNHDRLGVVITLGKNVEEALACAENAIESFNIRIKE